MRRQDRRAGCRELSRRHVSHPFAKNAKEWGTQPDWRGNADSSHVLTAQARLRAARNDKIMNSRCQRRPGSRSPFDLRRESSASLKKQVLRFAQDDKVDKDTVNVLAGARLLRSHVSHPFAENAKEWGTQPDCRGNADSSHVLTAQARLRAARNDKIMNSRCQRRLRSRSPFDSPRLASVVLPKAGPSLRSG